MFAPWKENYNQPRQHIQKQRHYFANKGPSSQGYAFSSGHVWMWELDFLKKVEHRRIDAFELWCWRRLLRFPWTARRSNQSILKEISSECSLKGLLLKQKLQYFGHLMRRADSFEKTLMLGGIWGQEEKGATEDEMVGWHHRLDGLGFGWTPGVGDGQGGLMCCGSWGRKVSDRTERLNWTELNWHKQFRKAKLLWESSLGFLPRDQGVFKQNRQQMESIVRTIKFRIGSVWLFVWLQILI